MRARAPAIIYGFAGPSPRVSFVCSSCAFWAFVAFAIISCAHSKMRCGGFGFFVTRKTRSIRPLQSSKLQVHKCQYLYGCVRIYEYMHCTRVFIQINKIPSPRENERKRWNRNRNVWHGWLCVRAGARVPAAGFESVALDIDSDEYSMGVAYVPAVDI